MRGLIDKEEKRFCGIEHYNMPDINGQLVISLRDLSHTIRSLYEGKGSQKRILIILNEVGTITQRTLTDRLGVQPGSASEVIAKLENAGLITRTLSESDRRTTDIALTEAGKKLADEALAQRNKRHEEMFACLSDTEKSELLTLLEKINLDWETRYSNIEKKPKHCGKLHH